MNLLNSECMRCEKAITVTQAEWYSAAAHFCDVCSNSMQQTYTGISNMGHSTTFTDTTQDKPEAWNSSVVVKKSTCECGATKAGSKYHSDWCKDYEDPMNSKPNNLDLFEDEEII